MNLLLFFYINYFIKLTIKDYKRDLVVIYYTGCDIYENVRKV